MPRPKPTEPQTMLKTRCPVALRDAFVKAANNNDTSASWLLRSWMREYVAANVASRKVA